MNALAKLGESFFNLMAFLTSLRASDKEELTVIYEDRIVKKK
jgi:hypothetical protein